VEWNSKVNVDKEISVIDYFKLIDPLSPFLAQYDTQRHLRKVFFEEFKIHSYDYVLLLFESVNRILNTNSKQEPAKTSAENDNKANRSRVNSPGSTNDR
jgi:hypothetical protein